MKNIAISNETDENSYAHVKWRIVLIATVVSLSHPIVEGQTTL